MTTVLGSWQREAEVDSSRQLSSPKHAGQPVRHALCRFHHNKSQCPPSPLSHPAKQAKTPIRPLLLPLTFFYVEPTADPNVDEKERHTYILYIHTYFHIRRLLQSDLLYRLILWEWSNSACRTSPFQTGVRYKDMSSILADQIAPSYMSPNVRGGGSCGVSANECSCTQEPKYTLEIF